MTIQVRCCSLRTHSPPGAPNMAQRAGYGKAAPTSSTLLGARVEYGEADQSKSESTQHNSTDRHPELVDVAVLGGSGRRRGHSRERRRQSAVRPRRPLGLDERRRAGGVRGADAGLTAALDVKARGAAGLRPLDVTELSYTEYTRDRPGRVGPSCLRPDPTKPERIPPDET